MKQRPSRPMLQAFHHGCMWLFEVSFLRGLDGILSDGREVNIGEQKGRRWYYCSPLFTPSHFPYKRIVRHCPHWLGQLDLRGTAAHHLQERVLKGIARVFSFFCCTSLPPQEWTCPLGHRTRRPMGQNPAEAQTLMRTRNVCVLQAAEILGLFVMQQCWLTHSPSAAKKRWELGRNVDLASNPSSAKYLRLGVVEQISHLAS